MNDDKNISTRDRILLCTEQAYAENGVDGMTVRGITETARVNLAAINYHFRSKQTLVEAMLSRILSPVVDTHTSLLSVFEAVYGPNIRPTHIMAALVLPVLAVIKSTDKQTESQAVLLRCMGDQAPMVRNFLGRQFNEAAERFAAAFARSVPKLGRQDAIWRARLFCNAMPGSIANQSVAQMCCNLLKDPQNTIKRVLREFSYIAEAAMTGSASQSHVDYLVETVFATLAEKSTFNEHPILKTLDVLRADPDVTGKASPQPAACFAFGSY